MGLDASSDNIIKLLGDDVSFRMRSEWVWKGDIIIRDYIVNMGLVRFWLKYKRVCVLEMMGLVKSMIWFGIANQLKWHDHSSLKHGHI